MPIYKEVNKDFFKKWTHDMAYILGFFSADGYITVNKRGGQFWCIQITDKKLLEDIQKTVRSNHTISERKREINEKTLYRLQIGSIEMCNDLRKLGLFEKKTKNMVVPNVPDKYLGSFVRGYFDGDGNIWMGYTHKNTKNPILTIQTMFTSSSFNFLKQLHSKLLKNILSGGSLYQPKPNYFRLLYSRNDTLKLYNFMYNGTVKLSRGLFLQRKKEVFDKFAAVAQR
ncbi:hypothetical protein A3C57_00175 [Candidatus Nomurabacteria bacterium RIFCSPHIGHO2_02_FULL_33_12]|uniref:DOD-type homing endonuclease domain-containing protein n=1 Tax=Candidatus Nomurabacteria bacterium RIFCSPLOWO2_01_FULL_33_17 TaxID=1801764 RepID=A0A1F6WPU6_9BACT|nr:MAG: hypothetical protein A3C57_00175 [Candidatus Nomurabacteria bacterium RIFCSPHIGHO2_02_FULL_33_12]OGI83903.1 MAG: hypothetical protein A2903_01030 [Candidatus Nomurabacteria bacterium RIFCSPLOWO2_01_FULL_33_17]